VYDHPAVKIEIEHPGLRRATLTMQVAEVFPPGIKEAWRIFKEYPQLAVMGEMARLLL